MMTLYEAFVPGCVQLLGSVAGLIDKAEAHCAERSLPPEHLIGARLAPDMLDFAYQVKSCAVHSIGAIEGIEKGLFSPDTSTPPRSFAGLKAQVDDAVHKLNALSTTDVERLTEKVIVFTIGDKLRWDFSGQGFLMSFSQPNFSFHAATAYAILRMAGVRIGKSDYLGTVQRLK